MVLIDFILIMSSCCHFFNIFLSSDNSDDKVIVRYCSFDELYDFCHDYLNNEIKKLVFDLSSISIYISDIQVYI